MLTARGEIPVAERDAAGGLVGEIPYRLHQRLEVRLIARQAGRPEDPVVLRVILPVVERQAVTTLDNLIVGHLRGGHLSGEDVQVDQALMKGSIVIKGTAGARNAFSAAG